MSIAKWFFNDEIKKQLSSSNFDLFNQLLEEQEKVLNSQIRYNNFKIKRIFTTQNPQADNPERKIYPNCGSAIVIGPSGVGKTTFFDKLIHPIISPNTILSPIREYVNGLNITYSTCKKKKNREDINNDLIFQFTTSLPNIISLSVNNKKNPKNKQYLKSLGLFDSFLTSFFFVSGQYDHLHLFSNFRGDISLFKKYFYHPLDLRMVKLLEKTINELSEKQYTISFRIKLLQNESKRINDYISKTNNQIKQYQNFLDNRDDINQLILKLRTNTNYHKFKSDLKEIQEKIKRIQEKIIIENHVLKDRENRTISKKYSNQYHRFIREQYEYSHRNCFVCQKEINFNQYLKKFESNICYLCNSKYDGYEIFTGEKYIEDEKKKKTLQKGLLNFINDKNRLHKERDKIKEKINILEKKDLSDKEIALKKIISPFYMEITRTNRNFGVLLNNFKDIKTSKEELVVKYQENILENNDKISEQKLKLESLENNLIILEKIFEDFNEYLEEDVKEIYLEFCNKISQFWYQLSQIKDKKIEEKNGQLFVVTVSKESLIPISTKITGLDPKQKRLSTSLVEILRYSIQLAFIYCLSSKFQNTPLKSIIFDDPNQKYLRSLIELLDSVFVKTLNFQILLLTHVEQIEFLWKKEEFQFYKGNLSNTNNIFSEIVNKWKDGQKNDNSIENNLKVE